MTHTPKSDLVYYPSDVARYETTSRAQKAQKIQRILQDFQKKEPDYQVFGQCLDVGCGPGIITNHLAPAFDYVVGIDLDPHAIQFGDHEKTSQNLSFLRGDVGRIPFPDQSFDSALCAQVYEHVPDPEALVAEIWRVLKPNGICFFSGPNRLAVLEEHYFLPFLSWFPQSLADQYVRLTGRGQIYDAYPYYLWQIKDLWRDFQRYDYSFELLRQPQHYQMGRKAQKLSWIANLPDSILNALAIFLPNYNWILIKPKS